MIKTDMKPGNISEETLWDIIRRCELSEKEEIAFNHSLHDIEYENKDTTWDIRVEGKLNKNNIIFKDKKYKELYLGMKKVDDKLKEKK